MDRTKIDVFFNDDGTLTFMLPKRLNDFERRAILNSIQGGHNHTSRLGYTCRDVDPVTAQINLRAE